MSAPLFSDFTEMKRRIDAGALRNLVDTLPVIPDLVTYSVPDVTKVGPEGYIHGFICIRPPCGEKPDRLKASDLSVRRDGTVLHKPSGYQVGHITRDDTGKFTVTHADEHKSSHKDRVTAVKALASHFNTGKTKLPDDSAVKPSKTPDAKLEDHAEIAAEKPSRTESLKPTKDNFSTDNSPAISELTSERANPIIMGLGSTERDGADLLGKYAGNVSNDDIKQLLTDTGEHDPLGWARASASNDYVRDVTGNPAKFSVDDSTGEIVQNEALDANRRVIDQIRNGTADKQEASFMANGLGFNTLKSSRNFYGEMPEHVKNLAKDVNTKENAYVAEKYGMVYSQADIDDLVKRYGADLADYRKVTPEERRKEVADAMDAVLSKHSYHQMTQKEANTLSRQYHIAGVMNAWNSAPTARSPFVQAFQKAAQEELGIDGARTSKDDFSQAAKQVYDANEATLRKLARAQYNATQETLKSKGITHIIVHRGMRWSNMNSVPDTLKNDDGKLKNGAVSLQQRPLSSWTTDKKTADDFISLPGTSTGKNKVIISADVPASRVFSLPLTGLGVAGYNEAVIMHSPGRVNSEVR